MKTKRNVNEVLSGLITLHDLLEDPFVTTTKEMVDKTGLKVRDVAVLSKQGILKAEQLQGNGRQHQWAWDSHRPNIHMAKKLIDTSVMSLYKNSKKSAAEECPQQDNEKKKVIPGVKECRRYVITKAYGNESFVLEITENDKTWEHNISDPDVELNGIFSVDKLKAIGFALITAAELMRKE